MTTQVVPQLIRQTANLRLNENFQFWFCFCSSPTNVSYGLDCLSKQAAFGAAAATEVWLHKTRPDLKVENGRTWLPRRTVSHLVVPDHGDVRGRVAGSTVVGDEVVLWPRDPAWGEEERVELHAQRFTPHVLHWQLAAGDQQREKKKKKCVWLVSLQQSPCLNSELAC